jgi:hypothetical protein
MSSFASSGPRGAVASISRRNGSRRREKLAGNKEYNDIVALPEEDGGAQLQQQL